MTISLTQQLRDAIQQQPDRPVIFEDGPSQTCYVLMTHDQFQRLVYDDSDLTPEEMIAAAAFHLEPSDDKDS